MEFKYDLRDLKFIIKEWLPTGDVLSCKRFRENYSVDDIDMFLNEAYKVAREVVNPINKEGDRIGARLVDGKVLPAPGYREAFRFLQQNGWGSSSECIGLDGGMPLIMFKAIYEMTLAACPSLASYLKLTSGAANLLIRFGTEEDRARFLPKMLSGEWQGTMCLTEPGVGSDVGEVASRAFPTEDPRVYKIKGTKMFITGGDAGICDNTIHMLLARPEGGAKGSPGLGLYIVPAVWVNQDGSLGERNDVVTVGLEHKMGLKAQATALLSFGDNDACRGIRLGPLPDAEGSSKGLAMMFHMMNESRIGTGHNANSQAAASFYYASQYAAERVQGRPFASRDGERVPIIRHEDVRRMLLDMKAHIEGLRAMIFKGFFCLDIQANSDDREKAAACGEFAEIITPLVKCYSSETSLKLIAEAMQVFGGAGYTCDYPVEQYMRDSKVLTIWEGTSFMHANDLVGRKMRMKNGKPFLNWMRSINEFIRTNRGNQDFAKEIDSLARLYGCVAEIKNLYDSWYADLANKKSLIPLYAVNALFVCAQAQVAQCLLEQALIAGRKLEQAPGAEDRAFYAGKVAGARYYLNHVVPHAFSLTEIIKNADSDLLRCPEETFLVS
ncbi:MAG: acyl-CoA dehydrogenase [Syntrophaceae bacterium]